MYIMVKSFLQRCYGGDSEWFSVKWLPGVQYIIYTAGDVFRAWDDGHCGSDCRASVSFHWPVAFGDGFRVCRADAETGHKCHRGQARRARQVADLQRLRREIRVFPLQAQTFTKNHSRSNAEARVRRVCGICGEKRMRNGTNHTVSPCPPSEDLEDLEQSGKAFNSGEEKAGIIKYIGASRYLAYGRLL